MNPVTGFIFYVIMLDMKNQRPTIQYSLIMGVFWASYAAVLGYASVYLLNYGFSNTRIGYVIAAGGIITAVLQPLIGGKCDRARNNVLHKVIIIVSLVMILLAGLLLIPGKSFWMIALLYGLLVIFLQINTPLTNSLGMFFIKKGVNVNFGIARGIGSLCYAGLAALLGILTERFSVDVIIWSVIIIYVLLIACIATFHFKGIKETNDYSETVKEQSSLLKFLSGHKRFSFVILGGICIFVCHNAIGNYLYQIMVFRGYGSKEMGFADSIMAAAELPTLFLLSVIVKKFRSGALVKTAAAFMFIKAIILVFARTLSLIYIAMFTQMVGYGLFAGASVYYVSHTIEEENQVRGQSLMTMIMSVGSVIGSLLAGFLLDKLSVPVMLTVSAAISLLGVLIIFAFAEKGKKE